MCLQHFFGKLLFVRHPETTAYELLVLRSVVSAGVFLVLMNQRIGYYLWAAIPKDKLGSLVSRILQGLVLMVLIYTSIKNFPLVFVSLVQNLTPLLTAVLSYLLFKVALSRQDTVVLLASFIGVTVLITGGEGGSSAWSGEDLIIPAACLVAIPVLSASVTLYIRNLR
jgi:drug/metabolite transporter (DMT)-like permease